MLRKYIKLTAEEANNFVFYITEDIASLPDLNLKIGADIRNYISYVHINGFSYIRTSLFDLRNKNRKYAMSEIEENMWLDIIALYDFKTVDLLPETESILS